MSNVVGIYNDDGNTQYIKKKLPLSGPDYSIKIDRKGAADDYSIQKNGDRIVVDHFDNSKDVTIINQLRDFAGNVSGRIVVDRFGTLNDETITQNGDRIFIDRPGFDKDVEITRRGSEITVNKLNTAQFTKYRKGEESWEIDRDGFRNDVKIYRDPANPNAIVIDKYGDADDVTVVRDDGLGLDVRVWHNDLTMTPEGFELITQWLEKGMNAEDLIHIAEDGTVRVLDNYLY